jgi:hypothetical protein
VAAGRSKGGQKEEKAEEGKGDTNTTAGLKEGREKGHGMIF